MCSSDEEILMCEDHRHSLDEKEHQQLHNHQLQQQKSKKKDKRHNLEKKFKLSTDHKNVVNSLIQDNSQILGKAVNVFLHPRREKCFRHVV
jgi:hypothetical protein